MSTTYADRRAAIARLRSFPDTLEALVTGLTEDQLDFRPPGEWSVRQIVHHLADSHMSANFRFRKPLTEDNPELMIYDQEAYAEQADYQLPIGISLDLLRGLHARWSVLLESLTEADWARTGTHPGWGTVTVEQIAYRYADHCDTHIGQIERRLRGE